jgi:hypothetical protein
MYMGNQAVIMKLMAKGYHDLSKAQMCVLVAKSSKFLASGFDSFEKNMSVHTLVHSLFLLLIGFCAKYVVKNGAVNVCFL